MARDTKSDAVGSTYQHPSDERSLDVYKVRLSPSWAVC